MKTPIILLYKRVLCFSIGIFCTGIGLGFCDMAGLGMDCLAVFSDGISKITKIPLSIINSSVNLILAGTAWFLSKRQVTLWTFLSPFILALGIETANIYVFRISDSGIAFFFCLSGILLMVFGTTLSISADIGKAPYDALVFAVMDKTAKRYAFIRGGFDAFWLTSGILIGGTFGIGTLLILLFFGRLVEIFKRLIDCVVLEPD